MKSKNRNSLTLITLFAFILQSVSLGPLSSPASAALTCAQGGICVPGDTGPGGGKIIYVASTPFPCGPTAASTCNALEWGNSAALLANPRTAFGQNVSVSHLGDLVGVNAQNGVIGEGYKNTMAWVAQNGAYDSVSNKYDSGYIRSLTLGGKTDWYLPNAAELAVLYSYISTYLPIFFDIPYYMNSSSEVDADNYIGWYFYPGVNPGPNAKASGGNNGLAAIRAFSSLAAAAEDTVASAAAARAAEVNAAIAKRETAIKEVRSDIANKLQKSEKVTIDLFKDADIAGVTIENIAEVQAEILALPVESRTDIKEVLKVARKFEVVGKIGSEQIATLPISALVEVGLIPADSKNKMAITRAVKRVEPSDRDSFAEIQAIIAAETLSISVRKNRLTAVIASIKNRFKG